MRTNHENWQSVSLLEFGGQGGPARGERVRITNVLAAAFEQHADEVREEATTARLDRGG